MHYFAVAMLMILSWLAPASAAAQSMWVCALSEDAVRLVCVADADPTQIAGPAPRQSALVNGTVFPLDPSRVYSVDLWSPPTEMAFVEELARATICYRSPGCSVVVAGWAESRHPGQLPAIAWAPSPRLNTATPTPRAR